MYKPPKSYVQSSEIIRTNYNPPRSCVQVVNMIHTSCRDHICTSLVQATEMYKSPRSYVCAWRSPRADSRDAQEKSPRLYVHRIALRSYMYICSRRDHVHRTIRRDHMYTSRRDHMYNSPRSHVQFADIILMSPFAEIVSTTRRDHMCTSR